MIKPKQYQLWTQAKSFTQLHFAVVLFSALLCVVLLIWLGSELSVWDKTTLIAAPILSGVYLSMFVIRLTVVENAVTFVLPHKKTEMMSNNITSVKIKTGRSGDYIELLTNRRIGIRKRFHFAIKNSESDVANLLNHFLKIGVPVYINPEKKTGVGLNKNTKQFEITRQEI